MSRTVKDMPYPVRSAEGHEGFSEPIIGKEAKSQNRHYRAVSRQKLRMEDYDIPKPKRNAAWLVS